MLELNTYREIPAYYLQEDFDELDLMQGTWDLSGAELTALDKYLLNFS